MEQAQRGEGRGSRLWTFVGRLVLALAAVVAFVLLFKRATAPERQLQEVLEAEAEALNRGDWKAFEALQDPEDVDFRRYQKSQFDSFVFARQRGESWAMTNQPIPYVVEVGRRDDEAWALVMEDPDGDPGPAEGPRPPAKIAFFRRAYGQWLHTGPDPDYWGQPQESRSEHILWRYREADAARVARLAARAEALAGQVSKDVGLELETNAVAINVCYSMDCGYVVYPLDRELNLPTALLFGYDEQMTESLLANLLIGHLVREAAGYDGPSLAAAERILDGVERWEEAQLTGEAWRPVALRDAVADGTLLSLEQFEVPLDDESSALVYAQSYTLVEYIVAQYGREVLPALVRAAGYRVGVVGALRETLGVDLDLAAFEAGWLDFVRERYGEQGAGGS